MSEWVQRVEVVVTKLDDGVETVHHYRFQGTGNSELTVTIEDDLQRTNALISFTDCRPATPIGTVSQAKVGGRTAEPPVF